MLRTVAMGVPKVYPFESVSIVFRVPGLGPAVSPGHGAGAITVGDEYGVLGRSRSVSAYRVIDITPSEKQIPPPQPHIAALLAICGKAGKTRLNVQDSALTPEVSTALNALVADYVSDIKNVIRRSKLPHDLPPPPFVDDEPPVAFPLKPALMKAFRPLGYDCRAGSGIFTLTRRTHSNLTSEVYLDVGGWSRAVSGYFAVHGLGFRERLPLPLSQESWGGVQYPIGGPSRWWQIVENLAAVVSEYEFSFIPRVEATSGPSPEWYQPGV